MYNFLNDYNDLAQVEILEELLACANDSYSGYGMDERSINAANMIKSALKDEHVDIHFVPGGTIANIVAIAAGLRRQESVLSAKTGHIQGNEAGAIEATGAKIELIDTEDGKLTPELVAKKLESFGPEYTTVPRVVYISNTTELGTVYTKEELKDLYDYCHSKGLYLYIDGARMAAALVSEHSNLKYEDLSRLCDMFTLGGTKNGLLFGEAIVIKHPDLKKHFRNLLKQRGSIMAKGFVLGIQFEVLFKDPEKYLNSARQAYKASKILAKGFEEKGYELLNPHVSNIIFVKMTTEEFDKISQISNVSIDHKDGDKVVVRFVTDYRTTEEDVRGFLSEI